MGVNRSKNLQRLECNRSPEISYERKPKRRSRLFSFKSDAGKDKTKAFRELIFNWKPEDIESLYKEFLALQVLYDLRVNANATRAPVRLLSEQLYRRRASSDVKFGSEVVELPVKHVDTCYSLKSFIKFLYTDEIENHPEEINELKEYYGCSRSLEEDLLRMEQGADTDGDFEMRFVSSTNLDDEVPPTFILRCHSDILMGRSSYFRQLITKWNRSDISIDEALFPWQYAHVVRYYLYTDKLDLTKIPEGVHTHSSLSEARAIIAGRNLNTSLNHAIRLVNIAKFFSLWRLVQLCEDAIVESLSTDTCVLVLNWAVANRCSYVRKTAQRFLEDNFYQIGFSRYFVELDREALLELVKSPFVQGTEVDILDAVLCWINPEGPPRFLSESASTSPDILEGKEDIRTSIQNVIEVMQHIRPDYVLPAFHEKLNKAYKLGYLDRPPLKVLDCSSTGDINPDSHWIKPEQQSVGPRLFLPYMKICENRLLALGSQVSPEWETWECPTLMTRVRLSEPIQDGQHILESAKPHMQGIVAWAERKFNFGCLTRDFHKKVAVEMLAELALNSAPLSSIEVEISYASSTPTPGGTLVFHHCSRDLPDLTLVPAETSEYPRERLFPSSGSPACRTKLFMDSNEKIEDADEISCTTPSESPDVTESSVTQTDL